MRCIASFGTHEHPLLRHVACDSSTQQPGFSSVECLGPPDAPYFLMLERRGGGGARRQPCTSALPVMHSNQSSPFNAPNKPSPWKEAQHRVWREPSQHGRQRCGFQRGILSGGKPQCRLTRHGRKRGHISTPNQLRRKGGNTAMRCHLLDWRIDDGLIHPRVGQDLRVLREVG